MASKKATTTSLTKWDAELAKFADDAAAVEKNVGGGNFISLAGGRIKYKGAEVPENKMNVIVIDHILENDYYTGGYDPDNPGPPECYAFGRDEDEMQPHEQVATPQNGTCTGCAQNEWGTADRGKGKACKNSRRLALVTEGDMGEIETAEIAYLKIPVTSVRAWAGYVRQLKDVMRKPPFAVVTEIELVPDVKTQFKLQFTCVQPIEEGDAIQALIAKHQQAEKEIAFPYQLVQVQAAPAAKPRAKARAAVAAAPAGATVAKARAGVAVGVRKAAKY